MAEAGEQGPDFDAGAYWRRRVGAGADLSVVGHRSMGLAYNVQVYERRVQALDAMIDRNLQGSSADLRVLDIGCGTGFYTNYWKSRGVTQYVGLDISDAALPRLQAEFPDFTFVNADISSLPPATMAALGTFDVVTVFDVLYHIVDPARFDAAVQTIGRVARQGAHVLIMDHLLPREYQLSKHVLHRAREAYMSNFRQSQLCLVDNELLFHFLLPPITGQRLLDYPIAAACKISGLLLRQNARLATWAARRIARLDASLRARRMPSANSELLMFERLSEKSGEQ